MHAAEDETVSVRDSADCRRLAIAILNSQLAVLYYILIIYYSSPAPRHSHQVANPPSLFLSIESLLSFRI
eukprot:scaffold275107_cov55-Attheya_sp.AAC.1